MKKLFLRKLYGSKITAGFLFIPLFFPDAFSQSLAINTTGATAHPSALLDVSSLNKGMLIPRIGLTDVTDVTTIPAPATSLMVYNTNATITGGSGTGFYFYTGSSWVKMIDGSTPLTGWSTTGNGGTVAGTNFVGTTDPADLVFKTNGAENMRILNATGRVAINTATATRLFQVNGDSRFQNNTYLDNNFFHYASNAGNTLFYRIAGMNGFNELTFGDQATNAINRFYLNTFSASTGLNFQSGTYLNLLYMDGVNGRVGLNQTPLNLTRRFQVNGDSRFQNNTYLDNNFFHYASNAGNTLFYRIAGMNGFNELTFGDQATNAINRFYLNTFSASTGLNFQSGTHLNLMYMDGVNGRVGIGTATPAHRLELSTDDAAKPGTGTWTVVSDIRMKQNIRPYTEGLSKLLQVEPVEYNYNAISGYDTKPSYIGVVAQDLQKIAPYMVGEFRKNGVEYLDVNTSAMTYMMINAIKEQQKMIDDLRKEIEVLKKR